MVGLFWKKARQAGALSAAIGSFVLSLAGKLLAPDFPFMNRMLIVFVATLALAVVVSLAMPARTGADRMDTSGVDTSTTTGFNVGAMGVMMILIALYTSWW